MQPATQGNNDNVRSVPYSLQTLLLSGCHRLLNDISSNQITYVSYVVYAKTLLLFVILPLK